MLLGETRWPKITIVTPNRNSGETLREAIESVVSQDYPNLEYIVVDGRSTDDSLEIIQEFAPFIDGFLYGKDHNMYDALAKGFDTASGDIFAWLNGDDIYEPGILRRVGKLFSEHPDWDVIYFDGTILKQGWRVPNRSQKVVGLPELIKGHILYQDDVFFTRRAYEAVGGIERRRFRLAGDYDLWLKLAAKFRLHYVPETASCFRLRPGQLSGDWGAYLGEMEVARASAVRSLPPGFWRRTRWGVQRRKWQTRRASSERRLVYPLCDEDSRWPEVHTGPSPPLSECLCALCGQPPRHMLFSSPDTWYGDRRIWQIYRCSSCNLSFLFPPPRLCDYERLDSRARSSEIPLVGEPEPGSYRLFQTGSLLEGNGWFLKLSRWHPQFEERTSAFPQVKEHPGAPILEIFNAEESRPDALTDRGFENVFQMAGECARYGIGRLSWNGPPLRAIVLHQMLQSVADPVTFLRHLRPWLQRKGRIYISTPNLDSAWLGHYGPVWSRWHPPFHQLIFSPSAIEKTAAAAGYRVRWMTSTSPAEWIYGSEQLAIRGLAGYISPRAERADGLRWAQAKGAAVASILRWDWRLKGDCLQVCLTPRG